jgi:chorismate mutase
MENAENKILLALRQEIDKIDSQILNLFGQRMRIITEVGKLKKDNKEKFFIRSAREADMIKGLINNPENPFPQSAIISIWRKIITVANMNEQPLHIAIHNPKNISDYEYLVREYYSDIVPISMFDSATNLVAAIEKGEAQIGVFALPFDNSENSNENWWISLANNRVGLKVFAKIPLIEKITNEKNRDQIQLVAAAIKAPEKSSSDNSLLYIELDKNFSKSQLLNIFKEQKINARILKVAKLAQVDSMLFYLLDVDGFVDENDALMQKLKKSEIKPYVKVLGHYATTIRI